MYLYIVLHVCIVYTACTWWGPIRLKPRLCISEMKNLCLYWVIGQRSSKVLFFPRIVHMFTMVFGPRYWLLRVLDLQNNELWSVTNLIYSKVARLVTILSIPDNVLKTALALYMDGESIALPLPTHEEILVCNQATTTEEVGTVEFLIIICTFQF